ncbi:MAG: hypothetical protein R2789_04760 [Microthrixaceae bacterium]
MTVTPDQLDELRHLRRARDLIDRAYAEPLDVPAMAEAAHMSPAHFRAGSGPRIRRRLTAT